MEASQLCDTCGKLDLPSHLKIPIAADSGLPLGKLRDIQERSSQCGFCRLVVAQIDAELPDGLYDAAGSARCFLTNRERWPEFEAQGGYHSDYVTKLHTAERKKALRSMRFTGHDTFCLRVITQPSINPYNVASSRYISRLVSRSHPPMDKLYHERLLHPRFVDFKLARSWLACCQVQHGLHCEKPSWLHIETPGFFRVVDIRNRHIIQAPAGCRFAALSYVWGGSPRNLKIYQASKPPYRLPPDDKMPETIRDAMLAALNLGFDYLWVDALCIRRALFP